MAAGNVATGSSTGLHTGPSQVPASRGSEGTVGTARQSSEAQPGAIPAPAAFCALGEQHGAFRGPPAWGPQRGVMTNCKTKSPNCTWDTCPTQNTGSVELQLLTNQTCWEQNVPNTEHVSCEEHMSYMECTFCYGTKLTTSEAQDTEHVPSGAPAARNQTC